MFVLFYILCIYQQIVIQTPKYTNPPDLIKVRTFLNQELTKTISLYRLQSLEQMMHQYETQLILPVTYIPPFLPLIVKENVIKNNLDIYFVSHFFVKSPFLHKCHKYLVQREEFHQREIYMQSFKQQVCFFLVFLAR